MPQILSSRKRGQIKKFFKSARKEKVLSNRSVHLEDAERNWVLLANVAGKKRVVKTEYQQRETKEVLNRLLARHKRAVQTGAIKPKAYELVYKNPYVYADRNVGIMDYINGANLMQIKLAISSKGREGSQFAKELVAKNPALTKEKMDAIFEEFSNHYSFLLTERGARGKFDAMFDLRKHNLLVVGISPITHLPQIILFDALGPADARHVREGLGFKKKRRLFDGNDRIIRKDS